MANIKTTATDSSVEAFLNAITPESTRDDCRTLTTLMSEATGCPAKMWGASIVGFDTFRYLYANGKPGEICLLGFSPRKRNLAIYGAGSQKDDAELLAKLGKIKTGAGCLYIDSLADVHLPTLKLLLRQSVKSRREASI